jgi:glycine oxidase
VPATIYKDLFIRPITSCGALAACCPSKSVATTGLVVAAILLTAPRTAAPYNNRMAQSSDILIIGGGVIGLSTAYFLAREGLRVEVVDKGAFGKEASWAGAGILPPGNPQHARHPMDQLRAHSAAMFPQLSAQLRERTGIDNGYLRSGGMEFLRSGDHASAQEWRGEGVAAEELAESAAADLEPALAPGLGPAILLPDMAQLRNPRHLKALLAGCAALGVYFRADCAVRGFERSGCRITRVRSDAGNLQADRYLVTTGAWTSELLEPLGWKLGVRPVRGQIVLLAADVPRLRRILLWGARYLVPRADGRVLVGSTEEDAGFAKRTTAEAVAQLLDLARTLVPSLAVAQVEQCWAGLRPGSPDGLPYLGPVPDLDNLFVAAGHFRAGIQLSPGSALVLTELLLGKKPTVALNAFRIDRAVRLPACL